MKKLTSFKTFAEARIPEYFERPWAQVVASMKKNGFKIFEGPRASSEYKKLQRQLGIELEGIHTIDNLAIYKRPSTDRGFIAFEDEGVLWLEYWGENEWSETERVELMEWKKSMKVFMQVWRKWMKSVNESEEGLDFTINEDYDDITSREEPISDEDPYDQDAWDYEMDHAESFWMKFNKGGADNDLGTVSRYRELLDFYIDQGYIFMSTHIKQSDLDDTSWTKLKFIDNSVLLAKIAGDYVSIRHGNPDDNPFSDDPSILFSPEYVHPDDGDGLAVDAMVLRPMLGSKRASFYAQVHEDTEAIFEALTQQQRIKRKASFRKNKSKIKRGKEKAKRKRLSPEKLKKKAEATARKMLVKKLTKGKDKGDLSFSQRQAIEKKVDKKKGAIKRIAKKLLPKLKKKDADKLKSKKDK